MSRPATFGPLIEIDPAVLHDRVALLREDAERDDPEHLWVYVTLFRLGGEAAEAAESGDSIPVILDYENLAVAGGPSCYRCNHVGYTLDRCPGGYTPEVGL